MLKELECLEIFTENKVVEEETVYQKLAKIRKKVFNPTKDLFRVYRRGKYSI